MRKTLMLVSMLLVCGLVFAGGGQEAKKAATISFTIMNYGDFTQQDALLKDLVARFQKESGIQVKYEIINWSQAREKITTWHLGGDAPDVSDMYWSYTFSDLGQGKFGTRPIENELKKYVPDLEDRYFGSALTDVIYKGHTYGIPWRIDGRPLVYRKDFLAEAGLDPQGLKTWDDLVSYGKALTKRDTAGNVTRWGVGFSTPDLSQFFYGWLWQAGGAFMDDQFKKATIDTPEGKQALQFLVDLVQVHKIASPDAVLDPSYDTTAEFAAGRIAILPAVGSMKAFIENNAPQLKAVTIPREPLTNKSQKTFQGAGYFGLNYQTKDVDSSMKWLAFLAKTDNMLAMSKVFGQLTPCKPALADPYFSQDWWFSGVVKALPYGRTSQHPNSAWGAITNAKSGSPIYDMVVNAVSGKIPVSEVLKTTQDKMQKFMDQTAK
jgi:multiple sugar transport system substrate-binding protein